MSASAIESVAWTCTTSGEPVALFARTPASMVNPIVRVNNLMVFHVVMLDHVLDPISILMGGPRQNLCHKPWHVDSYGRHHTKCSCQSKPPLQCSCHSRQRPAVRRWADITFMNLSASGWSALYGRTKSMSAPWSAKALAIGSRLRLTHHYYGVVVPSLTLITSSSVYPLFSLTLLTES